MQKLIIFIFIITLSGLTGCTSAKERAAEADADFKEKRVKILQSFQKCVDQHKGDAKMLESCEHYLKAIEAMR